MTLYSYYYTALKYSFIDIVHSPVIILHKQNDPAFLILQGQCSHSVHQSLQTSISGEQGERSQQNATGLVQDQVSIGHHPGLKKEIWKAGQEALTAYIEMVQSEIIEVPHPPQK